MVEIDEVAKPGRNREEVPSVGIDQQGAEGSGEASEAADERASVPTLGEGHLDNFGC